jgi:hypothetical protein
MKSSAQNQMFVGNRCRGGIRTIVSRYWRLDRTVFGSKQNDWVTTVPQLISMINPAGDSNPDPDLYRANLS